MHLAGVAKAVVGVVPMLTKSQVNKAGRTARLCLQGEIAWGPEVEASLDVIYLYRAAHQYPLIKANMGLRSVVRTEGCQVEVSQRLKRFRTILDKLVREPTMQLSTMQDIGGCRAVLHSIDEIRQVERRLQRNRPALRYSDYITNPRSSGYRGFTWSWGIRTLMERSEPSRSNSVPGRCTSGRSP